MKFRIVPSTSDGRQQLLTTYLINETLAIDAGAIAVGLSKDEQLRIGSIVITHAHLDHILSLPLFVTDLFEDIGDPVDVYLTDSDFEAVNKYLFNPRVWIGLETLKNSRTELLRFHTIKSGQAFIAEGLKITPVPVNHTVLTQGLLIEDDYSALLFTSDTGPTDQIWETANKCEKLRAIFIDLSFPNTYTELARISGHHSPETLLEELPKIRPDIDVYGVHLKAAYREAIVEEVRGLNIPRLKVAEIDVNYHF